MNAIELELLKNQLSSIVDDMSLTVVRTAVSPIVRESMDFSTGLCDSQGRMVAQGLALALHLGALPDAIRAVIDTFGPDFAPGDLYILNDPYSGGMHLPDIFMFKPVFSDSEEHLGFSIVVAHQADIGGRVPGGNAADSTEVFQEGLRIPPAKFHDRGAPNRTLMDIIAANVRLPEIVLGDIQSQVSACILGERGLQNLACRYGAGLAQAFAALFDYTELVTRRTFEALPEGQWSAEDWLDDNGIDPEPTRIVATVQIEKGTVTVDFTGSSAQVRGAINCTKSYAASAAYCALRFLLPSDMPTNEGFFRSIRIVAPEGSIVNPRFPAAVAARGITGYRVGDAVMGALAQAIPDRVMAGNWGGGTVISIGGTRPGGGRFVHTESLHGNWGGRPSADGIDGISHPMGNIANNPVEQCEADFPIRVLHYGFVADSAGPGRHRGGLGIRRKYQFLFDEGTLQVRADRLRFAARAVDGGGPGTLARNLLTRNGQTVELSSKFTMSVHKGECFEHVMAGASGHGPARERERAMARDDVIDGKVSPRLSADAYGHSFSAEELAFSTLAPAKKGE